MDSIAFFNNKGGVGKTTLACNVAGHMSLELQKRTLLVDCDPQCNSTQLILANDECDRIYRADDSDDSITLAKIVKPLTVGESEIDASPSPLLGSLNRFGVDLIPGHPDMARVEDLLGASWNSTQASEVGGFRRTNWCTALLNAYSDRYDIAVFDLSPSLGAINRSILLATDYFVTPMSCDIFSILGIRNMGHWIQGWIGEYEQSLSFFRSKHADALEEYQIAQTVPIKSGYVGYTVLQYITKSKGGKRRPTGAFERILRQIPLEIDNNLGKFVASGLDKDSLRLGDVPNMYSLVPLAQTANSPIFKLASADGLVGAQYHQLDQYAEFTAAITKRLVENLTRANPDA